MLAPSTKHPDSNQRRCPDSRQVLCSTCLIHVGTQHQTPRLQPEEMSRQQTSLVLHMLNSCWHPAPNTQTTNRGDDQTADKSCSPHASCWHPAPNTQTPARGGDDQTADKSCSPHASCWHPAPNTQTPTRGGDDQTADKSCAPHASCWHPAPNTQTQTVSMW